MKKFKNTDLDHLKPSAQLEATFKSSAILLKAILGNTLHVTSNQLNEFRHSM